MRKVWNEEQAGLSKKRSHTDSMEVRYKESQLREEALDHKVAVLEHKLDATEKEYKYMDLSLVKHEVRFEQDQVLISKQTGLIESQSQKIKQLQAIRVEQVQEIKRRDDESLKKNSQIQELNK